MAGSYHEQSTVVVETVTKSSSTSQFATEAATTSIAQPLETANIKATGIGLKKAFVGKKNVFQVDTKMAAGSNMLLVGVYGPKYPCDEVFVKHQGGGQYNVSYILKEKGEYVLVCKWGDNHIPGSPFKLEVV
jgi:filamin